MKRFPALLLVLSILLCCISLPASALTAEPYDSVHVVNCMEWISLRTSPSKSAHRILQIPLGAQCTYLGPAENGFAKVKYAGSTGYALTSYLSEVHPALKMYVDHCNEWVSLRQFPSTSAYRLAKIPLGAEVKAIGPADDRFMIVEYQGQRGYVLSEYLTFVSFFNPIRSARMKVAAADGNLFTQELHFADGTFDNMIRNAAPGITCQGAVGALLEFTLNDGSLLRFMMPTDGCRILIAENRAVYALPESSAIWDLFSQAWYATVAYE